MTKFKVTSPHGSVGHCTDLETAAQHPHQFNTPTNATEGTACLPAQVQYSNPIRGRVAAAAVNSYTGTVGVRGD